MSFIELIEDVPHIEKEIFAKVKKHPKPLMLFGAGAVAVFTIQHLRKNGIQPVCFCDNEKDKQGKDYLGLPVYSYNDFKEKYAKGYYILISTANMKDIYKGLMDAGESSDNILYMGDFRDPWSENTDYKFIKNDVKLFEEAYSSLEDELSKKIFVSVLNCKLSGNTAAVDEVRTYDHYFDKNIVKLKNDEVFMDVGAYTGDTIKDFIKHTRGNAERIIALEPDSKNYENIQTYLSGISGIKVELLKIGAWDKRESLSFADELTGSSGIIDSESPRGKTITIEVDAIDNILKGSRASFIKMDIEGAEHKAVTGAVKTIKKYRPLMAVSVYHKKEDIYDILLLLKSFVPDYKFYLRHYSDTAADTVLYAV